MLQLLLLLGSLDYSPAMNNNQLQVDDTGNTFAGLLNGRIKVYIDPYANTDYVTVGYRGSNPYDAGVFYCPYVPLQMVKAIGEDNFQPRIGFKTRYGMLQTHLLVLHLLTVLLLRPTLTTESSR